LLGYVGYSLVKKLLAIRKAEDEAPGNAKKSVQDETELAKVVENTDDPDKDDAANPSNEDLHNVNPSINAQGPAGYPSIDKEEVKEVKLTAEPSADDKANAERLAKIIAYESSNR